MTWRAACLLRPVDCHSQGDNRPAEAHRNPSGDQLQHKLAGVTAIIRHVIGKLNTGTPLFCHDPHFQWWRACRKAVPEHRQPVSFGEIEEHRRITACGNDPPGGGIRFEPTLFKILLPHRALYPILSIQDCACSAIGIEQSRRGSQLLELTSGFLATCAIAGACQDRRSERLELHLAALARRGKVFVLLLVHCDFPFLDHIQKAILAVVRNVRNGVVFRRRACQMRTHPMNGPLVSKTQSTTF